MRPNLTMAQAAGRRAGVALFNDGANLAPTFPCARHNANAKSRVRAAPLERHAAC